jgi:hypothetical protein
VDQPNPNPDLERYHGFSLRSVTWGYREVFAQTIEELFREGYLGPERREVTAAFFALLKQADQGCFDYLLRQFLGALGPANRWLLDLPGIFVDVVETGTALAKQKLNYGIRFFEILAKGGMGESPQQVRECLDWVRALRETDDELALAFLDGYARLARRLAPPEMERYLDVARQIHRGNPESGCRFLRGELATSEAYILAITQECRLVDITPALQALLAALTGTACAVEELGQLDSDDLIERGTATLTIEGHLYLPGSTRRLPAAPDNRNWYRLCALAAAALILEDSFARIHGHPEFRTCAALAGEDTARLNLFQILEFTRVLRRAARRWPGSRRLIAWGIRNELSKADPGTPEQLLLDALDETRQSPLLATFRRTADQAVNCFASAQRLGELDLPELLTAYPAVASQPLQPLGFLSDFLFPVHFASAPADQMIADLKNAARKQGSEGEEEASTGEGSGGEETEQAEETPANEPAFLYDEWDFQQNGYRKDWCHLRQRPLEPNPFAQPKPSWLEEARKVRAVFERLKPDLARREKHLPDGDTIDADRLLAHLVDRRREPSPPVRFYEKPIIHPRDLAVLVLLDVSGSTGEEMGHADRVLDVEKQAAVILGQGLATLGDRFAVGGFSSNGREQCEYLVFKDFAETWSPETMARILTAWPRNSTRIGPALRHAGHLMARQPARQRLIILVTDGKPMDQGYSPHTRYAQHDVRMACEENARRDIHTFAISTAENSLADMEIMFPRRRFVILPSIAQLPRVLPQLYLRWTL